MDHEQINIIDYREHQEEANNIADAKTDSTMQCE